MPDTPTNPFPAVSPMPNAWSGDTGGNFASPYPPPGAVSPTPGGFYPVNSPYPGSPPPGEAPSEQKTSTPVMIGLIAGVLVVVLATLGFLIWYITGNNKSEAQSTASPETTTQTSTIVERAQPQRPAPRVSTRAAWSPPAGVAACSGMGGDVLVNGVTSCEFAANVTSDYYSSGGSSVLYDVYSPVTGQYYDMSCSGVGSDSSGDSWALCTGGKNAQVYIRR
ncbi:hypothetical protein [Varibaculum prostatecancerukia]|uniref:hypothetical protein n=1 Tax=Varibaculum prostatecancerukia TaxID=2811781 RepID=UPI001C0067CD|nr:hypothetical protein [Varibaculum prostatecancerukia]